MRILAFILFVAVGLYALWSDSVFAQDTSDTITVKTADSKFEQILEGIHKAAQSDDWKSKDWKDPAISAWLGKLKDEVEAVTKRDDVRLPISFDGLEPVDGAELHKLDSNLLVTKSNAKIDFASNSILLSDGCLRVGFADNCILIARGAIDIAHSGGNFIIAGQHVHIAHDGRFTRKRAPGGGLREAEFATVLLSGGTAHVRHSIKTIGMAPRGLEIGFPNNVDLINTPEHKVAHGKPRLHEGELSFDFRADENPLKDGVRVQRVMKGNHALLQVGGEECMVLEGGKLLDADGKPLSGLEEWKLDFVCDSVAIFSDGKQYACFFIEQ